MAEQETKMWVLPPHPDKCQICGSAHDEAQPHNAQSMFYQVTFNLAHGRAPTWIDATAHCTPEVRELWRAALIDRGVDFDGGGVNPEKAEAAHG